MDNEELARRLREFLAAQDMKQREFERRAGMSSGYLSGLLSGKQNPKPKTLEGISRVTNWPLEELLGIPIDRSAGEGQVHSPAFNQIQLDLLRVEDLDPEALEPLQPLITAIREKAEREDRETRLATHRRRNSNQDGQAT